MTNGRKSLFHVEGTMMLIIVCAYVSIAVISLIQWSDKSGEIILGFALFAQSTVRSFFDWLNRDAGEPSEPTPTTLTRP